MPCKQSCKELYITCSSGGSNIKLISVNEGMGNQLPSLSSMQSE